MSGEGGSLNHKNIPMSKRLKRGTIVCPCCYSDAGIRDSHQETDLVKWLWCMCLNTDCGLTWKAQISFVYYLSPSAIERQDLDLPPPPPGYVRQVFPAGPPGAPPDPNQFTMFDEDELDAADRSEAA